MSTITETDIQILIDEVRALRQAFQELANALSTVPCQKCGAPIKRSPYSQICEKCELRR